MKFRKGWQLASPLNESPPMQFDHHHLTDNAMPELPHPGRNAERPTLSARLGHLKHGPGGSGLSGPCDADRRKCAVEARTGLKVDETGAPRAPTPGIDVPPKPTDDREDGVRRMSDKQNPVPKRELAISFVKFRTVVDIGGEGSETWSAVRAATSRLHGTTSVIDKGPRLVFTYHAGEQYQEVDVPMENIAQITRIPAEALEQAKNRTRVM